MFRLITAVALIVSLAGCGEDSDNPESALELDSSSRAVPTGASCSPNGSIRVGRTIVVNGTYDGNCQVHNPSFGDGSQSEGQDPVFRVNDGGTLKNVIIGNNGADGIHTYGDVTIENITWQNVGEDALTIKDSGTVRVRNIEGYDADDKFFQINAPSTLRVDNCIIKNAGKALRQNGGKTFKIDVAFNNCRIENMKEGVFRTDSSSSVASLSNSVLVNAKTLCIGKWQSCGKSNSSNGASSGASSSSASSTTPAASSDTPAAAIGESGSGYCGADGAIENRNGGYTGIGYTNTPNTTGVQIEYRVNAPSTGNYTVKIRYANGGTSMRAADLMSSSNSNTEFQFTGTGNWETWRTESRSIRLTAGSNRLELIADNGSGLPNIDYMLVERAPAGNCSDPISSTSGSSSSNNESVSASSDNSNSTTPESNPESVPSSGSSSTSSANSQQLVLEENQTGFCGADGPVESNHNGFRGEGFVNTENQNGASISYQVETSEANTYTLTVRYANGGAARNANLIVNDYIGSSSTFALASTGGWTRWNTESQNIVLSRGTNVLRLVATNGSGLPNVDSVSLSGARVNVEDCGNTSNGAASSGTNSGNSAAGSSNTGSSNTGSSNSTGGFALGTPNSTIRLSDPVPGWASQGGGTSGGGQDISRATTVSSFGALSSAVSGSNARIILVEPGTYRGDLNIGSNKTIIGVAPGVLIRGTIKVSGNDNVIVRNLALQSDRCGSLDNCRRGSDGIYIGNGASNVWFDHVDIMDGQDGNFDITKGANYVTCSWCRIRYTYDKEHAFASLIAGSDSETQSRGKLKISFMYTWWGEGIEQRQPRGRFGDVHVVNNLYTSQVSSSKLYAIGPGVEMAMIIENSVFKMASRGRAIKMTSYGDFRGVTARGNIGRAADKINLSAGSTFNIPYRYDLRPASEVESLLTTRDGGAGNTVVLRR